MIHLQQVNKRYKTAAGIRTVLDNVTVTFPKGHSVGILGMNGAGKSTLIRIIGDAEPADSGRIIRKGRVSWPLGFTGGFQSALTARENARFVGRIYGESTDYVEAFTEEFSELGSYFDVPLRSYSAGMRGRFAFSVSLACNFDYYLVDEALETGDARYKENSVALSRNVAKMPRSFWSPTMNRLFVAIAIWPRFCMKAILICMTISRSHAPVQVPPDSGSLIDECYFSKPGRCGGGANLAGYSLLWAHGFRYLCFRSAVCYSIGKIGSVRFRI